MKNRKTLGNLILLLTAMIWGAAFSFQSMAMETMTPLTFTATRMIFAAVFLWCLVLVMGTLARRRGGNSEAGKPAEGGSGEAEASGQPGLKAYILPGALCGLFLCLGTDLQQISLTLTTAGKAGFITAAYTVFVPILALIVFRKKTAVSCWIGAVLALVGVYFLSGAEGLALAPEDMLLIGCAVAFAFQILCIDHFVKDLDPVKLSAMQFTFSTLFSLLAAFIWEEPTFAMMTSALGAVLYAGVVSGGIGYTLQVIGQKLSDPAPAAILMSLEAVFSALFGAILLSQMMSGREILGSVIMLAAVILVQLSAIRES